MLPNKLTFLDLETTGLSPTRDRVIEIGAIRVENGKIKEKFETLIDPGIFLPPEITDITGISSEQLLLAPSFRVIKEKLDEIISDSVLVAHNAQFDVSFLKSEYDRLGESFKNNFFCTARLSRFLFPRFKRHNLDAIVERFQINSGIRHRAFSDAHVLWDFYQIVLKTFDETKIAQSIKTITKKRSLPKGISEELVNKLPKKAGVYVFYGESGAPLYVGKSVNIHDRVLSHFNSTHKSGRELTVWEQISSVECEVTGGELSALLRERELISTLGPIYNRQLRKLHQQVVATRIIDKKGYYTIKLQQMDGIDSSKLKDVVGVFKTIKKTKEVLGSLSDEYFLCRKLLGLEKTKGACFGCQIEKCAGACQGLEHCINYNVRFSEAFSKLKIKDWPFPGAVIFKEGKCGHLIDRWCYSGTVDGNNLYDVNIKNLELKFDFETYKILTKFLLNTKFAKNIVTL